MKHPAVSVAALPVLAIPASIAFPERIFRACTWYDDPLNQLLHDVCFERKVLLGFNADFREKRHST